ACTTELCTDGICGHTTPDPTCVPCDEASDCDDHNACTTDSCTDGICGHTTPDGPPPGEAAADCNDDNACTTDDAGADGACANNPGCPTAICGNCIDDDGDGKIDYEDDDCCDNTGSMTIRKMAVRTKSEVGKNRLVFKALYSPRVAPDFNPATAGTTLQLRD